MQKLLKARSTYFDISKQTSVPVNCLLPFSFNFVWVSFLFKLSLKFCFFNTEPCSFLINNETLLEISSHISYNKLKDEEYKNNVNNGRERSEKFNHIWKDTPSKISLWLFGLLLTPLDHWPLNYVLLKKYAYHQECKVCL